MIFFFFCLFFSFFLFSFNFKIIILRNINSIITKSKVSETVVVKNQGSKIWLANLGKTISFIDKVYLFILYFKYSFIIYLTKVLFSLYKNKPYK